MLLILVVSLALFPGLLLLFYPVAKQLPIGWDTYVHLWLPDHPDLELCLYSDGASGRPTPFDRAWVSVRNSRHSIRVEIDVKRLKGHLEEDGLAGSPQPFGGHLIAPLWRVEGRVTTPEQSQVAADAVVEALQRFSPDRLPPDYTHDWRGQAPGRLYDMAGTHIGEMDEPNIWLPWYTVYLVPVWLGLSYLFARRILRLHRRRVAGAGVHNA